MIKPCMAISCDEVDAVAAAPELRDDIGTRAPIPGCTCPPPGLIDLMTASADAWRRPWHVDASALAQAVMSGE